MIGDREIDLLLRLASLLAQIAIPVAIFYAGRYIARAQYTKSMQDAWNEFNKLAIANGDNIRVVRKLFDFALAQRSDDDARKAYLSFVALNTFQSSYFGAKHGLLDKKYQLESFEDLLKPYMADDDVYDLSQHRGYHPEFKEICRKIRKSVVQTQGGDAAKNALA